MFVNKIIFSENLTLGLGFAWTSDLGKLRKGGGEELEEVLDRWHHGEVLW